MLKSGLCILRGLRLFPNFIALTPNIQTIKWVAMPWGDGNDPTGLLVDRGEVTFKPGSFQSDPFIFIDSTNTTRWLG